MLTAPTAEQEWTVKRMDDLISRQMAIAYAISGLTREIDGENWIRVSEVRESIKALPSAQSEIIRCKDCKHRYIKNDVWTCPFGLPSGPDGYCSYGERKEE